MANSEWIQASGRINTIKRNLLSVSVLVTYLPRLFPAFKEIGFLWIVLVYTSIMPIDSFAYTASITLDHVDPANIIVRSQNNSYSDDVIIRELDMWANVNVEANMGSGIFQIDLQHKIQSSFRDREELSGVNSIPFHIEPVGAYHDRVKLFRPGYEIKRFAVDECNKNKVLMLNNGNRLNDIFARDHVVPVTIILGGKWIDRSRQHHQIPDSIVFAAFQITCAAQNNTDAALDSVDDRVYRVKETSIQTSNLTRADGTCEVAVQLGITTNKPNSQVNYQLFSPHIINRQNYYLMTDQYGRALGNHKLKLVNKSGIQSGSVQARGYSPAFLSDVSSYTINCPIEHGLTKVPDIKPPQGVPKDGKLKIPSISPSSGTVPREKPIAPTDTPKIDIPNNTLPKK